MMITWNSFLGRLLSLLLGEAMYWYWCPLPGLWGWAWGQGQATSGWFWVLCLPVSGSQFQDGWRLRDLEAAWLLVGEAVFCLAWNIPRLVLNGQWANREPGTNKLEGGFQNGLYWCPRSAMSTPKWLLPASMSTEWALVLPASLGGSLRSASGSDSSSFQITASALGLERCNFFFFFACPLRTESLSSMALQLSQTQAPLLSEPNVLGACPPDTESTGWGAHSGPWTPHPWGKKSFHFWVTYLGLWVLITLWLHPFSPSHCGSFFVFSAVEEFFC